eukprot:6711558-Lingulodinium_polyedra.AAC.1
MEAPSGGQVGPRLFPLSLESSIRAPLAVRPLWTQRASGRALRCSMLLQCAVKLASTMSTISRTTSAHCACCALGSVANNVSRPNMCVACV